MNRFYKFLGIITISAVFSLLHITYAQTKYPPDFVQIKGGTFTMGSPAGEAARGFDEAQHKVTVSSFYMSKYEVTQKEYEDVMGKNPSEVKGANLPVEMVNWNDAVEYCNKRSIKEGLKPAYTIKEQTLTWNKKANGYRLPTEAEWEYACRAGTTTPFNTGNNITTDQANYNGTMPYNGNAEGIYRDKTTPVGSFAPNKWGLYDMHGNVEEWCWDEYGMYFLAAQKDPVMGGYVIDLVIHGSPVVRGGNFGVPGNSVRSAYRTNRIPSGKYYWLGFRVVRP